MDSPAKYYRRDIKNFLDLVIPKDSSTFYINSYSVPKEYNYYVLNNTLSFIEDIQKLAKKISENANDNSRIVVVSFNFLWKPLLNFATSINLRRRDPQEPNWLTKNDIKNIFYLEGLEEIKSGNRFLFPLDFGIVSNLINRILGNLPLINNLCLSSYQIFRKVPDQKKYSVSVIIPARNEEGNIRGILRKIPRIGTKTEVIFVEGWSTDNTLPAIKNEIKSQKPKWMKAVLYQQKGKGKKDAVLLGFSRATNDILMILDADLTVAPTELRKFYLAISGGYAEFANGCRLIYPLEDGSMRTLNYFGNKVFSVLFIYLIGQKIKDTLCGTKALFRKDYLKIVKDKLISKNLDPFGDFDLLFGATNRNLKIIDIPVKYKERKYGSTKISRIRNGLELLKMTALAAKKIKFI